MDYPQILLNRIIKKNPLVKKTTFLLLNEMENQLDELEKKLRKMGFVGDIKRASSLNEFTKSYSENVNFIFLDWNTHDKERGITALKKVREICKETPVIMCTTIDEVESILEVIELGANDYIVKPLEIEELAKKIFYIFSNL